MSDRCPQGVDRFGCLPAIGRDVDFTGLSATMRRWARRCISVSCLCIALALALPLFPIAIVMALIRDLRVACGFSTTRLVCFCLVYLVCEVVGLSLALMLMLCALPLPARVEHAWLYWLQDRWTHSLFISLKVLFDLRFSVVGAEALSTGPAFVLFRHSSIADVILPAAFVAVAHRFRVRYVTKSELLWDPCMDIVGHRLPNHFVDRQSPSEADMEKISHLARGLGPREAVVLYPEGTRFSPAKKARIMARFRERGDTRMLGYAESLQHTLPIRPRGTLVLLEADPNVDVVVCVHRGLEPAGVLGQVLKGALVGADIRLEFWRFSAKDIPRDEVARVTWLNELWQRVDQWVAREVRADAANQKR